MTPYLEANPGLFILRAFTKTYAMAGLRLGYCLTADRELLEKMSAMVQPWNVSLPAQEAGLAALGEEGLPGLGQGADPDGAALPGGGTGKTGPLDLPLQRQLSAVLQ